MPGRISYGSHLKSHVDSLFRPAADAEHRHRPYLAKLVDSADVVTLVSTSHDNSFDKNKNVILYCGSGGRAALFFARSISKGEGPVRGGGAAAATGDDSRPTVETVLKSTV